MIRTDVLRKCDVQQKTENKMMKEHEKYKEQLFQKER
jgi:hypothetical protein